MTLCLQTSGCSGYSAELTRISTQGGERQGPTSSFQIQIQILQLSPHALPSRSCIGRRYEYLLPLWALDPTVSHHPSTNECGLIKSHNSDDMRYEPLDTSLQVGLPRSAKGPSGASGTSGVDLKGPSPVDASTCPSHNDRIGAAGGAQSEKVTRDEDVITMHEGAEEMIMDTAEAQEAGRDPAEEPPLGGGGGKGGKGRGRWEVRRQIRKERRKRAREAAAGGVEGEDTQPALPWIPGKRPISWTDMAPDAPASDSPTDVISCSSSCSFGPR